MRTLLLCSMTLIAAEMPIEGVNWSNLTALSALVLVLLFWVTKDRPAERLEAKKERDELRTHTEKMVNDVVAGFKEANATNMEGIKALSAGMQSVAEAMRQCAGKAQQ